LGRKRINKDNQTGDCKWINIERRREKRLKEKTHKIESVCLFHLFSSCRASKSKIGLVLILSEEKKAFLLGVCFI
jgi:hypothetical protein